MSPDRAPDACAMLDTSAVMCMATRLVATLVLLTGVYSQLAREDPEVHYSPVSPCNLAIQNLMTRF